ncbi:MAG: hypothetical protein ACREB2_13225, partial [Pseudolabrys sp.]
MITARDMADADAPEPLAPYNPAPAENLRQAPAHTATNRATYAPAAANSFRERLLLVVLFVTVLASS